MELRFKTVISQAASHETKLAMRGTWAVSDVKETTSQLTVYNRVVSGYAGQFVDQRIVLFAQLFKLD